VRKHAVEAAIPGLPRGRRRRAHGEGDNRAGQGRERESPREEEAQESQEDEGPQRCGVVPPTRQGEETPAARPRRTYCPERGGDHRRAVHDPERREFREEPDDNRITALKPKGQGGRCGPGRREPPNGDAVRLRDAASQSQEGMLRREAKAILVVSSSEGRTPRARLAGNTREIATGAKRRSRQERQGRNKTRRRQLREWWLVTIGLR